jgi:hypothetical protein
MAGKAIGVPRVMRRIVRSRYGGKANAVKHKQSEEQNGGSSKSVGNGPNADARTADCFRESGGCLHRLELSMDTLSLTLKAAPCKT